MPHNYALKQYLVLVFRSDLANIIIAITGLIELLLGAFGPWWTLAIVVLAALVPIGVLYWQQRQKDKRVDQLIAEKERSINRLAEQLRDLRVKLLVKDGWLLSDAISFVSDPWKTDLSSDSYKAQKQLEQQPAKKVTSKKSGRRETVNSEKGE